MTLEMFLGFLELVGLLVGLKILVVTLEIFSRTF